MKRKALFLDRDGVINIDHGYVYQKEKFEFTEGVFELLQLFTKRGYLLFVVTNQSGIGRGYYSEKDFLELTDYMLAEFKRHNIKIESVQYCKHAPEEFCECRKPATGMVDRILKEHEIDLENSWLIGDKQSDIDLAINSNIKHSIAIGQREIKKATLSFKTILECKEYFRGEDG